MPNPTIAAVEAALEVGLVNRVLAPTECNAFAQAQAKKLAAKPLAALRATKAVMKMGQVGLKAIMDEQGNVNIFLSEGAGVPEIIAELEAAGQEVQRDPFGHVQLDKVNPGAWFAKQFAEKLGAEKVMVQKSGYFSRSLNAYGQAGKPCARCGTPIERVVVGQRSSYFCPSCQVY